MEQVKEAFKRLVKQNHPDRLHGMSPALRQLAEAETKRLNIAFRQALIAVSRPDAATI
jgi:curved DNA-binding protein CbpA